MTHPIGPPRISVVAEDVVLIHDLSGMLMSERGVFANLIRSLPGGIIVDKAVSRRKMIG